MSCQRQLKTPGKEGFTLVEVIVALVILGIIMSFMGLYIYHTMRDSSRLSNQAQAQTEARADFTFIKAVANDTLRASVEADFPATADDKYDRYVFYKETSTINGQAAGRLVMKRIPKGATRTEADALTAADYNSFMPTRGFDIKFGGGASSTDCFRDPQPDASPYFSAGGGAAGDLAPASGDEPKERGYMLKIRVTTPGGKGVLRALDFYEEIYLENLPDGQTESELTAVQGGTNGRNYLLNRAGGAGGYLIISAPPETPEDNETKMNTV
ncbi:MAG: type II secretion system GspH family protein [Clostridiales bacterium]|nr:type II secretion system GspH family protein [Clostridiales bacterium]